jgi:hypothetical protein
MQARFEGALGWEFGLTHPGHTEAPGDQRGPDNKPDTLTYTSRRYHSKFCWGPPQLETKKDSRLCIPSFLEEGQQEKEADKGEIRTHAPFETTETRKSQDQGLKLLNVAP